jgi:hypothetical protein
MGTLSQTLVQLGIKGDLLGQASAPNMLIPPANSLPASSKRSSTASTFSTDDDDDKDSIISQKISDNEDDDYFPEEAVTNKRSSVHPGNSVWLQHSF